MTDETNTTSTQPAEVVDQDAAPAVASTPAETPAGKTFTQDDLDRLIDDRLKRERKKYADYSDLKKAATELEALKEAELSESERLQKQLVEMTEQLNKSTELTIQTQRQNAILQEASKLNFFDPGEAYALLRDSGDIVITEGQVIGADDAVRKLAESKPHLINKQRAYLESFDPAGKGQPAQETDAQKRRRIYGAGNWTDTITSAEDHGGGVRWNTKPEPKTE